MEHFSIDELCKSFTAETQNIANVPNSAAKKNLKRLIYTMLEPARELIGCPIIVTSGYRCSKLNAAVGGVKSSQHLQGLAADIISGNKRRYNKTLFELIKNSELPYDQLISEMTDQRTGWCEWVHVSIAPTGKTPRRQAIVTYR